MARSTNLFLERLAGGAFYVFTAAEPQRFSEPARLGVENRIGSHAFFSFSFFSNFFGGGAGRNHVGVRGTCRGVRE